MKVRQIISMCVVPVKVRFKRSGKVAKTLVIVDNYSQGSFVKTSLLKELELQGINTFVTIKTLNRDFNYSTKAIEGLEVSNADGKKEDRISLPRMLSQNELLAESDILATSNT